MFVKAINESDQGKEVEEDQIDRLEKALSRILGVVKIARELSQVLVYASIKGNVSYQKVKEIIKDDPEDVLLLADEWKLLLPVRTAKSSGWEDRVIRHCFSGEGL